MAVMCSVITVQNPSDIGLDNAGSIEGSRMQKNWFQNVWPKGMQDIKSAGDFVSQQFMDNKSAAIIDGPGKHKHIKDNKMNYGVAKIPTLDNGETYPTIWWRKRLGCK